MIKWNSIKCQFINEESHQHKISSMQIYSSPQAGQQNIYRKH